MPISTTDRQPVLRRLGTVVDGAGTASEVLEAARLANWNVRKTELYIHVDSGTDGEPRTTPQRVVGKMATVRDNPEIAGKIDTLGIVSPGYQTYQNEQLAEIIDQVTDVSGAHYQTAGSFGNGRRVFVNLKLPKGFTVGGMPSERHDLYLLGTTTHDGGGMAKFVTTPVRVVCQNTLAAALKNFETQFAIRHTGEVEVKAAEVREKLELQYEAVDAFSREAEKMLNEHMTDFEFYRMADALWEPTDTPVAKRRKDDLDYLWNDSPTTEGIRGTHWGALQVFIEQTDFYESPQGEDYNRAKKAVDGVGLRRKTKAYDLLKVL